MGPVFGRRTRSGAALLSLLMVGALGLGPASLAWAASDRTAAKSNSQWLANQLSADGTLQNPLGGALPDHGLMIDTLFAMHAAGDGELADPIARYLDDQRHATDYYTWDGLVPGQGYDAIITGGATAKVLVAAEVAGRDPHDFGGHDMVAETKNAIMRSGPDKGRISDYSKNPAFADFVSNNANMFGQALGVIGLAGAHENDQLAIDKLLTQQCSEGYFRIFFGYIKTNETGDQVNAAGYKVSSCDEGKAAAQSTPDGDTTGLALSAMLAARDAGASGLDEPITKAVNWLKANQTAGGGWGGGVGTEAPNTNSTGLIVQALADAGGPDAAVAKGVAFLKSAQITADADAGDALKDQIGAIAYTPDEYQSARSQGMNGTDTWIRASAQASLGLSQVGFSTLTGGKKADPPAPPSSQTPSAQENSPPVKKHTPVPATPVTAPPEQAPAPPTTPASRLGTYLAAQLVRGDHIETTQDGKTYVDYDATADLVLALRTLGEQPDAVIRASRFLLSPDSIKAYAHGVPYEKTPASYAEPLAKLQIVAQFLRSDPAAPPGLPETIQQLRIDLAALRTSDGHFVDAGGYADTSGSVQRDAWATLATTAGPDSAATDVVLQPLLAHQCKDGTFPASLNTGACQTGDLAATAAVVEALVMRAQPAAPAGAAQSAALTTPGNIAPRDWTPRRAAALESATAALAAKSNSEGVVLADDGTPDIPLSSSIAAARQSVGADVGVTAQTLGKLVLNDGGLGKTPATSIAAASGIAGRSWTAAPGSPVAAAVRLPLVASPSPAPALAAHASEPTPAPAGSIWPLISLIVLGFVLAVGAFFVIRHFTVRKTPHKGEIP